MYSRVEALKDNHSGHENARIFGPNVLARSDGKHGGVHLADIILTKAIRLAFRTPPPSVNQLNHHVATDKHHSQTGQC